MGTLFIIYFIMSVITFCVYGIDKFKAQKKKAEITEDDLKIAEKDITELVDKMIKEVEKVVEAKEKEILEV